MAAAGIVWGREARMRRPGSILRFFAREVCRFDETNGSSPE